MSKYNRTYHFPFSPGATNDDRIADDMSGLIGQDIVITEKLDGENTGMTRGGVYARSHAEYTTSGWSREVRQLQDRIKFDIPEDQFIFGENMEGIHSIEYTNLTSYFYIFGIRDNNIWIPWKDVEDWAYLLDIPTVPVLFKGTVKSEKELKTIVESLTKQPSSLGGQREGIVCRNASLFHNDDFAENVLKWVRSNHVTINTHWTRNWEKSKIKR